MSTSVFKSTKTQRNGASLSPLASTVSELGIHLLQQRYVIAVWPRQMFSIALTVMTDRSKCFLPLSHSQGQTERERERKSKWQNYLSVLCSPLNPAGFFA